jgi:hypothetical protein
MAGALSVPMTSATYLPGCADDLFISYSHVDDLPFGENESRWVSEFHRNLEIRVHTYVGRGVAIWRDRKLGGSDVFSEEIASRLRGAGILVSVVSPSYLQSEWCHRELQTFVEAAQLSGGITVGNKKRLVKVTKTPVPRPDLPEILDSILGHDFYHVEWGTDTVREFHLDPSPEARRRYWAKLDDVAQEIKGIFDTIIKQQSTSPIASKPCATIYLAATSSDLQNERDVLRRELQDRGHIILPDKPLPWSAERFAEAVRSDLRRASLSIHLLGSHYGMVPEGETRSIVELQSDLASESDEPGFRRIFWLGPNLKIDEERQRAFVESLHLHSTRSDRFELLESSLEELKTVVLDKLQEPPPQAEPARDKDAPVQIYLVCEQRDRAQVEQFRRYLVERGHEVILPLANGEPQQVRQDHHENLLLCDAILIYWGSADEFWLRSKVRDLARARGLGRTQPFAASAVLVADPQSAEKEQFQTREALVIQASAKDDPLSLAPFLAELRKHHDA